MKVSHSNSNSVKFLLARLLNGLPPADLFEGTFLNASELTGTDNSLLSFLPTRPTSTSRSFRS